MLLPADEGGQVDQRRLRLYERSKLRYYYAIITCDSAGECAWWGRRGMQHSRACIAGLV